MDLCYYSFEWIAIDDKNIETPMLQGQSSFALEAAVECRTGFV